ncbi:MAG TPA: hypothetical protein VFZ97_18225 [Acidimicrobiales bacterium]
MPWWSWAIIGYVGLIVLLAAALMTVSGVIELRSRLRCRRVVRGAERFLAEALSSVGSSSVPG